MGPWQTAVRTVRGWDRNIKLFFLTNLLFQAGSGMFSVLYNLYVQALGYGQTLNGQLISLASFATALMFIPIGITGDRFGRKRLLSIGIWGTGIAGLGRSFAESAAALEGFAVLHGLFMAAIQVLAVPFLADYAKKEERLRLLSYHFSATLAAQVLGSTGGGLLADLLQWTGTGRTASLQIALAVGSAAVWAAAIPLMGIREQRRTGEAPAVSGTQAAAAESAGDAPRDAEREPDAAHAPDAAPTPAPVPAPEPADARRDRTIIAQFAFTQLLIGIGSGLVIPYLNLYFTDRFSVSLTMVGILISLGQIMTIASMLMGPRLVKRVGQVRAVLTFQLLSLPFLLITGFTGMLWIATIGYLFRQALMNAANPIHSSILVDRVSPARRGAANSINQTMFMLGWAFMGYVQPAILARYGVYWGYAITFCLTGALYITSAACFYLMLREPRPASLEAEASARSTAAE
ncbi:MFS transporter [Gorillibacterium sp. sgz5001074]|uniref:MFS transporter n=1 Tax=Gorillibacterium sp. sgz5001074 TaxID=3446695 RepID=UPI003F672C7E